MKRFAKFLLNLLAALFGVATIASGYGGMVNPLRTTIPAIISLTFPICLIATVILLIIALFRSRKAAIICALALLATAGPIFSFCPIHFGSKSTAGKPAITVLSYNVMQLCDYADGSKPKSDNPTLQFIIDSGADIVALQECSSLRKSASAKLSAKQLAALHAAYPYRAAGPEGQALLSRYPFKEIKLSAKPGHNFQVRAYAIETPLGSVNLFNLHLKSIGLTDTDKKLYRQFTDGEAVVGKPLKSELGKLRRGPLSKLSAAFQSRARQARKVKELIDSVGGTVIVCGDFNDIPGSYAARTILSAGLKDAYREAGCGPAISYHASRFFFRIDQIFASPMLQPVSARVVKTPHSDHYPIQARFISE